MNDTIKRCPMCGGVPVLVGVELSAYTPQRGQAIVTHGYCLHRAPTALAALVRPTQKALETSVAPTQGLHTIQGEVIASREVGDA